MLAHRVYSSFIKVINMRIRPIGIVLIVVCSLLSACDPNKQPAQAAYAKVEASVAPVREMLEKYAPEEYEQLNQTMDSMRTKLNSDDYQGALEMQSKVMAQLAAASSAAGQRKNSMVRGLSNEWKTLVATVPGMVEQVTARVNSLLTANKLPAGVSRETVVRSQGIAAQLSGQWNAALSSAQRNSFDDAVKQGNEVKKRCLDVATALNLKLSE
ncbi:MAG TPA: hypothetical protein VHL14_14935 [Steroidobacteraceae bacterium]|nr:hypothetical protein [Steroidobacteraceae bacterium]